MGDESVSLLQMQEKCHSQAKEIDRLREELNSERRKEVEYANKVGEDPSSFRTFKFQLCCIPSTQTILLRAGYLAFRNKSRSYALVLY